MNDLILYLLGIGLFSIAWIIIEKPRRINIIYLIIHTFWGFCFIYFTKTNQADAIKFYEYGSIKYCPFIGNTSIFSSQSEFTYCISGASKFVFNNYGFTTSIFSFLGFYGTNILLNICLKDSFNKLHKNLTKLVFLLPSVSFWTSGVGKDALVILFYSLVYQFIVRDEKSKQSTSINIYRVKPGKYLKLILALIGSYMTRSYTAYILLTSFCISRITDAINSLRRLYIGRSQVILIPIIIYLLLATYFVLGNIIGLRGGQQFNLVSLLKRAELSEIAAQLSGGSVIPFTGFLKSVYILFGPFSVSSPTFAVESITGLLILIITLNLLNQIRKLNLKIKFQNPKISFLITMIILELSKLNLLTFNTGIAVRQRVPILLFIILLSTILSSEISILKFKKKLS